MRVTKVDGLSRTKHWALGAVIAALCSFAYAKAPGMPHFGGGGGGFAHASVNHAMRGDMRGGGRFGGFGAPGARSVPAFGSMSAARPAPAPSRNASFDRNAGSPRNGANFARGPAGGDGFGVYNSGMRRPAGPSGYPNDARGGMQYAGAITPVSAESRSVPRPPPNAPVRAGSIRADVARYNEERGSARAMQRQNDDPRQAEGSPYRN
ncbi:hypothetical protein LFL96_01325 [Paraburkholderia sp. D15]|uniref:hypothetical protein n=1 Tax=Paraburkholderia sp. D15 TaxID=2880218 RepID=UPI00247AA481|nr:hypothetical protein [Paraburkholderia sp. D15]WGS50179.1 hypothetical protein LFL96_01325 [Paraburkholderia sp. D15]WKF58059.1 hypothetical protein HUO10_002556 [Paraburkholderia busanensis]